MPAESPSPTGAPRAGTALTGAAPTGTPSTRTFRTSADFHDIDLALVHGFLSGESYWATGIPLQTLERALRNSICCSGHLDGRQVAFARAVTDQATFAYLADVFVLPAHRGHGYGRAVVEALMADPRLQGLRRWHLVTRDMQRLYAGLGFAPLTQPERHMQKHDPDAYRSPVRG